MMAVRTGEVRTTGALPVTGRMLAVACIAMLLAGCSTVGYYAQAVSGQFDLVMRARPVERVLADPATPAALRERLARAAAIREFASRELGLPDNGSYRSYADLGRPYVVWNVFAAPALSVRPRLSCFPVAGCVSYRGFYAEADARAHAAALAAEGNDVYVGGVPAYSTLGWFDDPLLSTFIGYPDAELARLVFHALSHQLLYVRDDTVFNESFAVAVELEGVRRWLAANGDAAGQARFDRGQAMRAQFLALVARTRDELSALYRGGDSDADKLAGKQAALARFRADYALLKQEWGGFAGYDRVLEGGLNNALLVAVTSYAELVPAFQAMLARAGGSLPEFYAEARRVAALSASERRAALHLLMDRR